MSQLLHYSRELSPHWLDLAHVVAGAPMHLQAARVAPEYLRGAYTDELPELPGQRRGPVPSARPSRMAGAFGGMGRFAVSLVAATVSLALPGSSWLIDTLRS